MKASNQGERKDILQEIGLAGDVTAERVLEYLGGKKKKKVDIRKAIKLSADVYEKRGSVCGMV